MLNLRLRARCVLLAMLGVLLLTPLTNNASAGVVSVCGLLAHPIPLRCFPASRAAAAEHEIPVRRVRPTHAVHTAVPLPLIHMVVYPAARPFAITYIYGSVPIGSQGAPDVEARKPHYVLVDEIANHPANGQGPPVKTGSGPNRWYWELAFNLRCRNLTIIVTTNLPVRVARTIRQGLTRETRCGKD